MPKDICSHPYHLEQELQRQSTLRTSQDNSQEQSKKPSAYFTWLVFMSAKWVPFDASNQTKLEQTLHLGGTFVDIEDSNFPKVKRVRVFPKSNYLSYLGVKYRLSRVMQPDAWVEAFEQPTSPVPQLQSPSAPPPPPLSRHTSSFLRYLPPPSPPTMTITQRQHTTSLLPPSTSSNQSTVLPWSSNSSPHPLISHVLS